MKKRKLLIVDMTEESTVPKKPVAPAVLAEIEKLRAMKKGEHPWVEYGKNLDTLAKARAWLTDQRNWFPGQTYIVKWDGLTPTVCANHGQQLLDNPDDDGLPHVIVIAQMNYRIGGKKEEPEVVDVIE